MKRHHLTTLNKDELDALAQVLIGSLISNLDFFASFVTRNDIPDQLKTLYGDEAFVDDLLSDEDRVLFKKMIDPKRRRSKAEIIEAIDRIIDDRVLFEGFAIAFSGSDEELKHIMTMVKREDEIKKLLKDKVFKKRRTYVQKMAQTAKAAIELYGVISIEEIYDIIEHYHLIELEDEGYQRKRGWYKKTVFASSNYYSIDILYMYLQFLSAKIIFTTDGLLLDQSFEREFDMEMAELIACDGQNMTQDIYDQMIDRFDNTYSYRRFYLKNIDKPLYLPYSADDFLRFATGQKEKSLTSEEYREYLNDNFRRHIKLPFEVAINKGVILDMVISDIVDLTLDIVDDHNADISADLDLAFADIQKFMAEFGIRLKKDEKIEMMVYLTSLHNCARLWQNRGYTNRELEQMAPIDMLLKGDIKGLFDELARRKRPDLIGEEIVENDPDTGKKIVRIKRHITPQKK